MRARVRLACLLLAGLGGGAACGNATWKAETGAGGSGAAGGGGAGTGGRGSTGAGGVGGFGAGFAGFDGGVAGTFGGARGGGAGTNSSGGGRGGTAGSGPGSGGSSSRGGSAGTSAGPGGRGGSGGVAGASATGGTSGKAGSVGTGGLGGFAGGWGGRGGSSFGGTGGGGGAAGRDDAGAGGGAGQSAISYLGCTYVGGIDRIVVSKRDVDRDVCINVVLSSPGSALNGLSLPYNFGLESAVVGPAASCPSRAAAGVHATQVTGAVDAAAGGQAGYPTRVNVNLTVVFPPADASAATVESMTAQNLDVQAPCP